MNNIEINISNSIGNILGKLDIGDADINTVFSLVDVREPDKRNTNHTKTFTIPGTKRNHQIFTHIQTEGFEAWNYNPNFKLTAQILVNGNQYFNGYLQLNDLVKDDSDNIVGYNITIYQEFTNFYKNIDVKMIGLIDLSEYDHEYNYLNIIRSWDKSIIKNGAVSAFNLGDGYVYPYDWKGQSDFRNYAINDFKPAMYLKTLVDKVFKSQGVTYQSNFFESEYFKKLIIPYGGDSDIKLTKEQIDRTSTRVGYNDQPSNPSKPPGVAYDIYLLNIDSRTNAKWTADPVFTDKSDSLNSYYDSNNNYTFEKMVVPKNGKYIFNIRLFTRIFFTTIDKDGLPHGEIKAVGGDYELMIYLRKNGSTIDTYKYTMTNSNYDQWKPAYTTDIIEASEEYVGNFALGDQISVRLELISTKSRYSTKTLVKNIAGIAVQKTTLVKLNLTNIDVTNIGDQRPIFSMALVDEKVEEGDTLDMNSFIPDMKAGDLIKTVNKMFNLYWQPIGDSEFLIEPRDNFYIGGKIKDWTYAVDEESEITMVPLYELTSNKYIFTYSEDDDFYNTDYIDDYEEVYSTKEINIENDFIDQTLEIKPLFAASPLIKFNGTDRKGVGYVDEENNYKKPKIRILFYGGLIKTSNPWFIKSTINGNIFSGFTKYPYAGHLDNPDSPTWDLSWSVPKKYYYNWDALVNSNLFNMFWRSQIEEITDKNGHLLTGTFILDDLDMIEFDIRDTIQFRGVYYRVNKITHNPLLGVADVELLKLKTYTAFKTSTISGNVASGNGNVAGTRWGSNSTIITTSTITSGSTGFRTPYIWRVPQTWNSSNPTFQPVLQEVIRPSPSFGDIVPTKSYYDTKVSNINNNSYSKQGSVKILGINNYVAPTALNIEVSGDNNKVGNITKNIRITGNNNLVESGVENVTIIGDNKHVRRSNVSYIYGNIIDEAGVRTNITILRGSTNGCVVRGGIDSVKANMIYNGGQNTI